MAEEWFVQDGPMNDVVVSTRVRLTRNLLGFNFPERLKSDDRERVSSLVKDAINKAEDKLGLSFNLARTENMKENALSLLEERGLRADESDMVAMLPAGDVCILVNDRDHLRIIAFTAGLDVDGAVKKARQVDDALQESLQFAATREAGYLTSAFKDSGSGMKISARVHLPSIVYCDKADIFVKGQQAEGFGAEPVYHDYNDDDINPYEAIGSYYDVFTTSSIANEGNETDQMAGIVSDIRHLAETERKFRKQCADNNRTLVQDIVVRDSCTVKVASFMDEREAEELISAIKWGVDLGLLSGVDYKAFARLNYLVKDAHVDAAMQGSSFKFESDIKDDDEMKRCRIRAVIVGGMLSSVSSA